MLNPVTPKGVGCLFYTSLFSWYLSHTLIFPFLNIIPFLLNTMAGTFSQFVSS